MCVFSLPNIRLKLLRIIFNHCSKADKPNSCAFNHIALVFSVFLDIGCDWQTEEIFLCSNAKRILFIFKKVKKVTKTLNNI